MLKNTLCNAVEKLIVQYQLTEYQQRKCREFFEVQKSGDFIYAGHLKSKISVDIKTAYEMLEELKKGEFLVNIYEVYCFDCSKSKGVFLESITSFDENFACDFCGKDFLPEENLIVLYKVLHI